jgi:hypothetical protein
VLAVLVALGPQAPPVSDPDLATGIRQVEEEQFQQALLTLDPVVRRLEGRPELVRELAQAHLYLGIAYAVLDRPDRAREEFRHALRNDRNAALPVPVAPAARGPFEAARRNEGKRGSGTALVLGVAGVVGVGAAVAVAVAGGSSPSTPNPPPSPSPAATPEPPPPARPSDLSAAVTSMQATRTLNCRDNVFARITLTNGAASSVTVNGIRRITKVAFGGCAPAPNFVYAPQMRSVSGGETGVIFDGTLYPQGSGCCDRGRVCDGSNTCGIEENFTVMTSVGDVSAGRFGYRVNYLNCVMCPRFGATLCGAQSLVEP